MSSGDIQVGTIGQYFAYTILKTFNQKNNVNNIIINHQFDDYDKELKTDFSMKIDNEYIYADVKTSIDHSDSVSISLQKDGEFYLHPYLDKINLNKSQWFIFIFRDINKFVMVRTTTNFLNFLKENNCFKETCIAINYHQINLYNKNINKTDIKWFNIDGITFGDFFSRHWKRENWQGLSESERSKKCKEILEICENELGPNSDIPA